MSANPIWKSADEFGEQVLTTLKHVGHGLDHPDDFNFFLCFGTEHKARACGAQLQAAGFETSVELTDAGGRWVCQGRKRLTPHARAFAEVGAVCLHLAEQYAGEFDGWEIALPPLTIPEGLPPISLLPRNLPERSAARSAA